MHSSPTSNPLRHLSRCAVCALGVATIFVASCGRETVPPNEMDKRLPAGIASPLIDYGPSMRRTYHSGGEPPSETRFEYDDLGRITVVSSPPYERKTFDYSPTDGEIVRTLKELFKDGEVYKTQTTDYKRDSDGSWTGWVDVVTDLGDGNERVYEYEVHRDELDRITLIADPQAADGYFIGYEYDADTNMVAEMQSGDHLWFYEPDEDGRLGRRSFRADGRDHSYSDFHYNDAGFMVEESGTSVRATFEYEFDSEGRPRRATEFHHGWRFRETEYTTLGSSFTYESEGFPAMLWVTDVYYRGEYDLYTEGRRR